MALDLTCVASDLQPALTQLLAATAGHPPLAGATLGFYRKRSALLKPELRSDIPVTTAWVNATSSYRRFRLWIINQHPTRLQPVLVHFHGGGFVMGNCENSFPRLQHIANQLGCVVVSVEYGLAPEVRAAESLQQNFAALAWIHHHGSELKLDTTKIVLFGVSAGGGHAALLSQQVAQRGELSLAGQVLAYPMLDDRTGCTVSADHQVAHFVWTADQNRYGWHAFLGKKPGGQKVADTYVPARQTDVNGLPPTFIGVGRLDLFFAENTDYAQRLKRCGVPVEYCCVDGAYHAFDSIAAGTPTADWFTNKLIGAIDKMFNATT